MRKSKKQLAARNTIHCEGVRGWKIPNRPLPWLEAEWLVPGRRSPDWLSPRLLLLLPPPAGSTAFGRKTGNRDCREGGAMQGQLLLNVPHQACCSSGPPVSCSRQVACVTAAVKGRCSVPRKQLPSKAGVASAGQSRLQHCTDVGNIAKGIHICRPASQRLASNKCNQ